MKHFKYFEWTASLHNRRDKWIIIKQDRLTLKHMGWRYYKSSPDQPGFVVRIAPFSDRPTKKINPPPVEALRKIIEDVFTREWEPNEII